MDGPDVNRCHTCAKRFISDSAIDREPGICDENL